MTASNFLACFNETESFEGLNANNPHDPGGATRKGVTQRVYTAWLASQGRPNASVFNAPDADVEAIYRAQYWNAVRGDDLFDGLDMVMVDSGWGSGPVTAIMWLQRLLDVEVDGHFGALTLAAVQQRWNSADLINALCARRLAFFQSLNTWQYFGVGWGRRLAGVQATALKMNAAAQSVA
jgi:lysozyme family protein